MIRREYDVVLCHNMRWMHFTSGAYYCSNSKIFNHMQSCIIHKNNISIFLIIKVTKCWNSHDDTFNNNFNMFLHLWKDWDKISLCLISLFRDSLCAFVLLVLFVCWRCYCWEFSCKFFPARGGLTVYNHLKSFFKILFLRFLSILSNVICDLESMLLSI